MKFIGVLMLAGFISAVVSQNHYVCQPWRDIESKLSSDTLATNCSTTKNCSGMNCDMQKFGYQIHCGLHVEACEKSPYVEFTVDIPKLQVNHWKKKFYHSDQFSLRDGLRGELTFKKNSKVLVIGLTLQMEKELSSLFLHFIPHVLPDLKYEALHDVSYILPECSRFSSDSSTGDKSLTTNKIVSNASLSSDSKSMGDHLTFSNCSIRVHSCPIHEMCQQINISQPEGICSCIPNYAREEDGHCGYHPTTTTTTTSTTTTTTTTENPSHHTDPKHKPKSSLSLLLTAILVPITVILIIVGSVYIMIRFRICQRMRRRLRVPVYEQVLLGEEEDEQNDDDDEQLNPVV